MLLLVHLRLKVRLAYLHCVLEYKHGRVLELTEHPSVSDSLREHKAVHILRFALIRPLDHFYFYKLIEVHWIVKLSR